MQANIRNMGINMQKLNDYFLASGKILGYITILTGIAMTVLILKAVFS